MTLLIRNIIKILLKTRHIYVENKDDVQIQDKTDKQIEFTFIELFPMIFTYLNIKNSHNIILCTIILYFIQEYT